jgi:8-oxo-dGTP diphosphatase
VLTLVRHAHAGDKSHWKESDATRPLSDRGWQQAAGLAQNLSGVPEPRLISSPYLRCQQTLLPLSTLLGRPIEQCDLLAPGADPVQLADLLGDPALDGAVLCTHGETLADLMLHCRDRLTLEDRAGETIPARGGTEKGAAWIIVTDDTGMHAHYLRPLLVGDHVLSESWGRASD